MALAALACLLPGAASAGYVFQFAPTNPRAGSKYITVRAIPTPAGYEGVQVPNARHFLNLYLIRHADAPTVHSVRDSRLIPLGRFTWMDTRVRLPHLRTGTYAMAAECVGCRPPALYVIGVGVDKWGIAPLMLLHASAPPKAYPMWPFATVALFAFVIMATARIVVRRHRRVTTDAQNRRVVGVVR